MHITIWREKICARHRKCYQIVQPEVVKSKPGVAWALYWAKLKSSTNQFSPLLYDFQSYQNSLALLYIFFCTTLSISNSFEFKNVVFLDKLTLSNAEYFERISLGISAAFSKSSAQNLAEKSFFSCTIKHICNIYVYTNYVLLQFQEILQIFCEYRKSLKENQEKIIHKWCNFRLSLALLWLESISQRLFCFKKGYCQIFDLSEKQKSIITYDNAS